MLNFRKIIAMAAVSLLAACASTPPVGGAPNTQVATVSDLPTPGVADLAPSVTDAQLRPLDVLQVDLFGVEDLSREVQVGANGTFDYPLIGAVNAVGRTPEELARELESRLRQSYVLDPNVTVRLKGRAQQYVTVGGEVSSPGRLPIEGPVTLMEAVAMGGGLDEYAKRDEVLVFRTVDGERYIGVYNLQGIQRGNYADPTVYPNDIVMVGDSPGRRRLENILSLATAISSPLVILERVLQ
ncbi:polysaccharide biosynthesis/export family protein [Aurantiacibacter luteus]|uniref:polysaccharide biosynthesis/export family protein n=1 Tax=Aurantiacibacter luteus TaxID=1581420 RepID=UPI00069C6E08|nr:polysaccharide biosynthesis/export family protein [Aurantiacibacter luteus]